MIPLKNINYANCLTLMRILLLPVYLLFLLSGLLGQDTKHLLISLFLYLILGLGDFLDGIIARTIPGRILAGKKMGDRKSMGK